MYIVREKLVKLRDSDKSINYIDENIPRVSGGDCVIPLPRNAGRSISDVSGWQSRRLVDIAIKTLSPI